MIVKTFEKNVFLESFINKFNKNINIIICPGGGYGYISNRESYPVAYEFLSRGFNSHILNYSVAERAKFPKPIEDLYKAINYIKKEYGGKIILLGFSAGANLCGQYIYRGESWNKKFCNKVDLVLLGYPPVDFYSEEIENLQELNRDLIFFKDAKMIEDIAKSSDRILAEGINSAVFGKIKPDSYELEKSSLFNIENNKEYPPIFIFSTIEDKIVKANKVLEFAKELDKNKIKYELHLFQWGEHGLSLGKETSAIKKEQIDFHYNKWIDLAESWINKNFNKSKEKL